VQIHYLNMGARGTPIPPTDGMPADQFADRIHLVESTEDLLSILKTGYVVSQRFLLGIDLFDHRQSDQFADGAILV
jgi:hypothetical protein